MGVRGVNMASVAGTVALWPVVAVAPLPECVSMGFLSGQVNF